MELADDGDLQVNIILNLVENKKSSFALKENRRRINLESCI
jgi:hypothetical protein